MAENLKKKEEDEIDIDVEVRCGGKVLVTDFSKLREEDFPYVNFKTLNLEEQLALPARNGQLYVNKNLMASEQVLIPLLEILMNSPRKTLNKFERMYRKKYRGLTFDNLAEFIENNDEQSIVEGIYYLLIPVERTRRFVERSYYCGNKK